MKYTIHLLLVLGFAGATALYAEPATPSRPNVLLICVDDLKPSLGCYGDPHALTPNIDRLAARGVVFERAYCNQAVCSPSRNALLTGLRPQSLGIYDLPTNFRLAAPDIVTLPQHFKPQGYRTEAMGKIFHVGHGNQDDERFWSVPHFQTNRRGGANPPRKNRQAANLKLPKGKAFDNADVDDSEYADGKVADEAIRRLQAAQAKPDEPFFLAIGFVKPHLPFIAPKKYWDLHDRSKFSLAAWKEPPAGAPSYAPQFGGELRSYRGIPKEGPLPDDLQRTLIHGYYAAASYMDAQVGRVIAALDESGLAKNTIIVFWGDHGWHLGDHGMWCKHTNYEQAARIPLIFVAPGITPTGGTSQAFAESVDIYPTLSELTGLAPPIGVDGTSLIENLRDPNLKGKESAIHVYPRGERLGRAIRTDRYRLVEWKVPGAASDTAEIELYDYEADPQETKNIAASEPEVVAKLRATLAQHPEAKPQLKQGKESPQTSLLLEGQKPINVD